MKDIFSELYKKVLSFFNNEAREEESSKDTACNRLKLVLMQDRAKMEPALMEKMREEMIEVISKYVEIDKEALDLNLEAEGESFALMLNIPVLRAKTREEIEAAEGIINEEEDDDDDDIEDTEELDDEASEENTEEEDEVEDSEEETESESEEKTEEKVEDEETPEVEVSEIDEKPSSLQTTAEEKPFKPSVPKNKYKHQKDDDL